jgi:hypothetical protein
MAAEYGLTPSAHIVLHFHDGTVTSFRDDVESRENAAYQEWLGAGGVPTPYTSAETSGINAALDGVGTGKTTNQILGVA